MKEIGDKNHNRRDLFQVKIKTIILKNDDKKNENKNKIKKICNRE